MDDSFKHLRKWQKMMNQINRNQEMINRMTRASELANKMANSSVVESYMEHASAFEKANTMASTLMNSDAFAIYKQSNILELMNSGVVAHLINNPMHTMANIPRHDLSQMASAVAGMSNQGLAFSNAYQFAPFLNYISSAINSSFVDNLSEYIQDTDGDNLDEVEELHEEDVQFEIKRPYFFDMAIKINIIVNATNAEVQEGNLNKEEVSTLKKVLIPILTILGQIFLAWAMSATPIYETNIYKSIESIIHYMDTIDIDFDEVEQPDLEAQ